MSYHRGAILLLAVAICSCGTGKPQEQSNSLLHVSDPYVQALDAVFNLRGCRKDQDSRVASVIDRLAQAEKAAKSRGLETYSSRAHRTFEVAISDVLRVVCPDFRTALKDADEKVERLRLRVSTLAPTDSVNQ